MSSPMSSKSSSSSSLQHDDDTEHTHEELKNAPNASGAYYIDPQIPQADTLFEYEQVLLPFQPGVSGYPQNWDLSQMLEVQTALDEDLDLDLPSNSQEHCKLITLERESLEYEIIGHEFGRVNLEVYEIERVENTVLWDKFKMEKEHMCKNRPDDFSVNECYLYHGTTAAKETISEEGLDMRLSHLGHFGKGTYFSDNPLKCVQYASSGSAPYIIKCRVLLGDIKIYSDGQRDTELKREPLKPNAKGPWKYYDSVKGKPRDFNEFVIYENRRVLVEYVITYKASRKAREYLEQQVTKATMAKKGTEQLMRQPIIIRENCQHESTGSNKLEEPSLGMLHEVITFERQPSLERLNEMGQRRPSLERLNEAGQSSLDSGQRQPSLERLNEIGQRRPSLERLNEALDSGQRRSSLERLNEIGQRRPSLERLETTGLSERSSSLEGLDQIYQENVNRQSSLEHLQQSQDSIGDDFRHMEVNEHGPSSLEDTILKLIDDDQDETGIQPSEPLLQNVSVIQRHLQGRNDIDSQTLLQSLQMTYDENKVTTIPDLEPEEEVRNILADNFKSVTSETDEAIAIAYLERTNMNLEEAITLYYDDKDRCGDTYLYGHT